nr:protein white-like [Cherax quadricarinatus]
MYNEEKQAQDMVTNEAVNTRQVNRERPAVKQNGEVSIQVEKKLSGGEQLTYSWEKVNVFAVTATGCGKKKKTQETHILKDVAGICRPGELLAIMGASGAGKTTLLNVLTFRSDDALRITGSLYVNGQRVTPDLLTSRSAYVQQEDLFIGTFTVREQLLFQAHLRMDRHLSHEMRVKRVEEVMQELSLTKCAKTLIGVPGRLKGISGGETKRLAFACEVLTNPALMFLDEPTSGLDSFMAQNIVQAMRNLASKNKTVISTIHQPSSEVFALFDRVLLMGEGRVAFLGSTSDALQFFSGLGRSCPKNYNPADFFISELAIEAGNEAECRTRVDSTCNAFLSSTSGQQVAYAVAENKKSFSDANGVSPNHVHVSKGKADTRYCYKLDIELTNVKHILTSSSSWYQVLIVTAISFYTFEQFYLVILHLVIVHRFSVGLRIHLCTHQLIALLVGVIFLNQETNQDGITNLNGALFLLLTQMSFSNSMGVVNTFCSELPIFLREHFNGMYRTSVYFLCKNLAELPLALIQPAVFTAITYYMIGLSTDAKNFFVCMAILMLVANAAISFGYLVSCLARTVPMAMVIAAPLLIPLMLFGGFFLSADSVPVYFVWVRYISWFNYGNEALMINQWADVEKFSDCEENRTLCYHTGTEVIESLGYSKDNMGLDVGLLFALIFGYRIIGYLLLLLKTNRKTVKQYE